MMKSVRVISFLLILLCTSLPAVADTVWQSENGETIFQPQLTDGASFIGSDANGYSLVVWGDERGENRNIYGQLLDADHDPLWPENGLALVDLPDFQNPVSVVHSGDGWIVIWLDNRDPDELDWAPDRILKLYIQKFNDNGEPQWNDEEQPPESGVFVVDGNFPSEGYEIVLLSDNAGGAYVVYVLEDAEFDQADPIAQHVLSDGSFAWTEYGVNMLGPEGVQPTSMRRIDAALADDGDGIIAGWIGRPGPTESEVRAQRVYADGSIWNYDEAPLISAQDIDSYYLSLCTDGANGAYVTWYEPEIVIVQRVAADGSLPWNGLGEPVVVNETAYRPIIVPSTDYTAIVLCQLTDDAYPGAQRVGGDTGIVRHWGDDGVALILTATMQPNKAVADGNGGAVVNYHGGINRANLIHVDVDGTVQFNTSLNDGHVLQEEASLSRAGDDKVSLSYFRADGFASIRFQSYDLISQQLEFPLAGLNLTTGAYGAFYDEGMAVLNGDPFFAWIDMRTFRYNDMPVFQAADRTSGDKLLGEYGVPLLPGFPDPDDPASIEFRDLLITPTGDGTLIASCFGMTLQPEWDQGYYLQKVTPSGDLLWGETGSQFITSALSGWYDDYRLVGTEDGGAILIFEYMNDNFWLRLGMQRFSPDGEPIWSQGEDNFIPINDPDIDDDAVLTDVAEFSDGSLFILVKTSNDDVVEGYRVSPAGDVLWTNPVLINPDDDVRATAAAFGEAMLVIMNRRIDGPDSDIEGQLISMDGDFLWDDGPRLILSHDYGVVLSTVSVDVTDDQHFWITYVISDGYDEYVHCQLVNSQGEVQLIPVEGPRLSEQGWYIDLSDDASQILPDNSLYVTWEARQSYTYQIQYRRINADGTFPVQYLNGPITISGEGDYTSEPIMVCDGDGGAYVYWEAEDYPILPQETERLKAQRLNDGFMGVSEPGASGTPDTWTLHQAYPNPFNATTSIHIDLPQRTHLKAQVFDILGREVMTIADQPFSAGRHTLTVNAEALASGMYFLRVNQPGGATRLQKLVLLK